MSFRSQIGCRILPLFMRAFGLQQLASQWLADVSHPTSSLRRPADPFGTILWVNRCISSIANNLSSIPLMLTTPDDTVIESGSLYGLLRQPSLGMSGNKFIQFILIHLNLFGEFFILKMRPENSAPTSAPTELIVLPPDQMEAETAVHAITGQTVLIGWKIRIQGGRFYNINLSDVIHGSFPNPENPLRGLSPWEAAWPSGASYKAAEEYNATSFQNQAVPSGILKSKQTLTEEQLKSARTAWQTQYAGIRNSKKVIAMGSDWDFQSISLNPKELEYIEGQKLDIIKICAAFGVPPAEVGWMEYAHESNAREQKLTFWINTLIPQGEMVSSSLQRGLVDAYDWGRSSSRSPTGRMRMSVRDFRSRAMNTDSRSKIFIWLDYSQSPALMWDRLNRHDTATKAFALGVPFNDINEKLDLGYEPTPWGDVGFLPFSVTPASEVAAGAASNSTAPSNFKLPEQSLSSSFDRMENLIRSMQDPRVLESRNLRARRWREHDSKIEAIARRLQSSYKSFFYSQRQEVLSRLAATQKTAPQTRSLAADILFDLAEETSRLVVKIRPILRGAIENSGKALAKEIPGDNTYQVGARAESWLKSFLDRSEEVNRTTRERLEELIDSGDITDTDSLAEKIREIYRDRETNGARTAGETDAVGSYNAGRNDAMDQFGIQEQEWLSARDNRVRPTHEEADGQRVAIDESFEVGGEQLRFPGDPEGSLEEIINCRCVAVPVISDLA